MKRKNIFFAAAVFLSIAMFACILLISGILIIPNSNILFFEENSPPAKPIPPGCGILKIYVINVSEADSILIITPSNKTILIDAGSASQNNSSQRAVEFMQNLGISRIDVLIASHYHEDHIGGMKGIFENFEVGKIYDSGNCGVSTSNVAKTFQGYAVQYSRTVVISDLELGVDSCLSDAKLLAPYSTHTGGCWPANDENDNSLALHIAYGNTSMLFAGDCEGACEQELMKRGATIRSNFLKVGHHGSATASSAEFLSAVRADYYAISVDKARSASLTYFLPRTVPLGNIYAQDPQGPGSLFRTDLNGDITAISDGSSLVIVSPSSAAKCALFSGYSESKASSYGPIPPLASECG